MLIKTRGYVKWYNPVKRYGFVVVDDMPDMLVHENALIPGQELFKKSKVEVLAQEFDAGWRVQEVLSVDNSEAERDRGSHRLDHAGPESDFVIGYMKGFDKKRGFGFVEIPSLDADAFLHITALNRCGVRIIPETNDPVLIKCRESEGRLVVSTLSAGRVKNAKART